MNHIRNKFTDFKNLLALFVFFFIGKTAFSQLPCGQNIDFNTWSQEGVLASGSWNVLAGGSTVQQNINGNPTWFVSPNDFFNVLIEGSIQVNTVNDDDMVGFVFGYQNPIGPLATPNSTYIKSFLFDWKQGNQVYQGNTGFEGFALMEMDGLFDFVSGGPTGLFQTLWARVNTPTLTVLDTDYGNNGWNDLQQYNFQLKYTADSIVIWIDNVRIFEETGCFEPGRFGFYNLSQGSVNYSNFSYNIEYDFEMSDSITCVNNSVDLEIGSGCLATLPPTTNFSWDFGDNSTATGIDPSHTYATPGIYDLQLFASDPFGCVDTSEQTIEILAYPIPNAGIDDSSCTLSYNLSASPPTGSWSGTPGVIFSSINSANTLVTVPAQGTYTFTWEATNAGGCSATDNVNILFNDPSVTAVLTNPSCNSGNDGEIQLSVQGLVGPITYQWDANTNNQTANPAISLSSGAYFVSISNGSGCSIDSIFNLTEPSALSYTIALTPSDCDTGTGSATISNVSGGTAPYSYDWGAGPTLTDNGQNIPLGTFNVTISDFNGCDSTFSYTILPNPFVASISNSTNVTCFGINDGTATASGPSAMGVYTYQWGVSSGSQTTATATNLSPGTHTVTVSTSNGCSDVVTIDITEPLELLITQTTNESVCIGATVVLSATATGGTIPYSYLWGNGIGAIQNPSVVVNQAEQYSITVTDSNGCIATDNAFVDILGTPIPSFLVDTLYSCMDPLHEYTFSNTSTPAGLSATWDFGDFSFDSSDFVTHTYTSSGVYSVSLTITDGMGCTVTLTEPNFITVSENPIAEFEFGPDFITTFSSTVNFTDESYNNIIAWNWDFAGLGSSSVQNPTYTFPELAGAYLTSLEVSNSAGCVNSTSEEIVVRDDMNLYAPNAFTPDGNEFNQNWRVYTTGFDLFDMEITLYNRWGEIVWKSFDIEVPWDGTYNGTVVPDGVYSWSVTTKSITTDEKFEFNGHVVVMR